jgi:transposase
MFAGLHDAAQNAAVIHSLLASCKVNDVAPFQWLKNVLTRIQDQSANKLQDLLPGQK